MFLGSYKYEKIKSDGSDGNVLYVFQVVSNRKPNGCDMSCTNDLCRHEKAIDYV